jgi:hypothetical protein
MRYLDRLARALAFALLFVAWTDSGAAEFAAPSDDGWHVWQVQGAEGGANACCYRWRKGSAKKQSCDLDGRHGGSITLGDCDLEGDQINIYVRMKNGKAAKIRALTADCPVTTQSPVHDMGNMSNADSVAWLTRQVDANGRIAEDAIAAISVYAGDAAFTALTGLLEDRGRGKKTREQALFWLAQTNSDRAFEYLDALISRN